MLLTPRMPCPACGTTVPNRTIGGHYRCKQCGLELQPAHSQSVIEGVIETFLAVVAAWLLGFRGWKLIPMTFLIFVVLLFALLPVWERFWPTWLEPYGTGMRRRRTDSPGAKK